MYMSQAGNLGKEFLLLCMHLSEAGASNAMVHMHILK